LLSYRCTALSVIDKQNVVPRGAWEVTLSLKEVRRDQALNKSQFHERLREFCGGNSSDDATVCPNYAYGRRPWIYILDEHRVFVLNADTKRKAVREYLELVAQHSDDLRWELRPSQRGNMTAVAYGPHGLPVQSFYLYAAGVASPRGALRDRDLRAERPGAPAAADRR
jgi:hypothetical protein